MMDLAVRVAGLDVFFGARQILHKVDFAAYKQGITVLAGRSGSGKTTLLRSLNRLNETFADCHSHGRIEIDLGQGLEDILGAHARPVTELRRRVGMVFQTPDVLPVSIARNIALPLRVVAEAPAPEIDDRVQAALHAVGLWNEVADRLDAPAASLSGGQQQRLCLARALALEPSMLLLDEPTASLDVQAAHDIEELLLSLVGRYPLVVVSHSPEQAVRLASRLVVFEAGRVQHEFAANEVDAAGLAAMLESGRV